MQAQTTYFNLNDDAIAITNVEWLENGTDVSGRLDPTTLRRLDASSRSWVEETTAQPQQYFLLSTPGIKDQARIGVFPQASTVSGEKIRVHYVQHASTAELATEVVEPEDVDVYAFLALAIMLPPYSDDLAGEYRGRYEEAVLEMKTRRNSMYREGLGARDLGETRFI